ncbi:MAG TPA: dihydrodipicolinate synthase family protein [Terracidiphilus sp.]|jgi:4-hydroxy-tetrahydrodipicolinate synthase
MTDKKPGGIVCALVTPFQEDESIDYGAWKSVIEYQIWSGIDGFFAVGTGGEFYALTEAERREAASFVIGAVGGRIPIYAQVGAVTTRESVALARHAEGEGADYLVVITPYYIRPTDDEIVRHYQEICDSVKAPVFAYNIPGRTGVALTAAVVRRIAESQPNFIGLKDSSGKIGQVSDWIELGLSVFMGSDNLIYPALELGCAGAVAVCANVAPKLFVQLFQAWKNGDSAEASRLQALAAELRLSLGLSAAHPLIKQAMALGGLPAGVSRRPSGLVSSAELEGLHAIIAKLRENNFLPGQDRAC